MTIRGIYNADGITTYTVADTHLITSKSLGGKIIYGESDLKVTAQTAPAMSVKVSSGLCSINGAMLQNRASHTVTIESNSASYSRIDSIVAYISGTTFDIRVLKGTPSSLPSAPNTTASYYLKLAEVTVGVGVTSIQENNIKDCRNENNQRIIDSLSSITFELLDYINTMKECELQVIRDPSEGIAATFQKIKGQNYGILKAYSASIQTAQSNGTLSLELNLSLNGYSFINTERCSYSLEVVPEFNLGYNNWQGVNGAFGRTMWLKNNGTLVIILHGLTSGQRYVLKWSVEGFGKK